MIKTFIKILRHCLQMGNFNGLQAISGALDSAAVHRLEATWSLVPRKYREEWARIRGYFFDPNDKYIRLREAQQVGMLGDLEVENLEDYALKKRPKMASFCIPWIGLYLHDLVYIGEAHPLHVIPSKLKSNDERFERLKHSSERPLFNLNRSRLVAPLLRRIYQCQRSLYDTPKTRKRYTMPLLAKVQPSKALQHWLMSKLHPEAPGLLADEFEQWKRSLQIEPRKNK